MAPSAITITESPAYVNHGPIFSIPSTFKSASYDESYSSEEMVGDAMRKRVQNIDLDDCEPGDEDAFFVADMGEIYRQHLRWKLNLGRVKPFYGMFFF
jgi:ornithine decarboxylase